MQYLALLYSSEEKRPNPASPEFPAIMKAYQAAGAKFNEDGIMLGSNPLQPVSTAKSVRVLDGKTVVTDGPFAETKERLGGYYLLECRDLDHAVEMAALIPAAEYGTVELRPIMHIPSPE